jgi:hypothetical protein
MMMKIMNSKHRRIPLPVKEQPTNLTLVAETLDIANEHGMAAEVMWSALTMAAEANEHGLTMEQVLEAALGEWDI